MLKKIASDQNILLLIRLIIGTEPLHSQVKVYLKGSDLWRFS